MLKNQGQAQPVAEQDTGDAGGAKTAVFATLGQAAENGPRTGCGGSIASPYEANEAWRQQQAAERERLIAQQTRTGALNVAMAVYQAGGLKMDVDTLLIEAAKVEKYLLHGQPASVLN